MSPANAGRSLDPITREVVANSLISAAREMSTALRRSAYSTIIYDMLDYSCALFGPRGELVSQAENLPAQLGVMSTAISEMLRKFPPRTIAQGDVFIMNHPYMGATHTLDLIVVTPFFYDGVLMGFAGTNAHHMDLGGKSATTEACDNTEIYQEGLLLPIVKLYAGGKPNQGLLDVVSANVRLSKETMGDIRAQIAACRTGERRWSEICDRFGANLTAEHIAGLWAYTEARVQQEIAGMDPGVYEAEGLMDPDYYGNEPLRIKVRIVMTESTVHADFTGTDPQVKGAINNPLSSTISAVWYAVRCLMDPDIPHNEGFYRPIGCDVPLGSLLNPLPPAAVSARHATQQKVADVMLKALRPAKLNRTAAGCSIAFPTIGFGGTDPRTGEAYLCVDIIGGGMGAHANGDGLSAVDTHTGNCAMMSAEGMETGFPIRVQKTELVPDSGGAGKYRGGLAMERTYELLAPRALVPDHQCDQTLQQTAPWAAEQGEPGGLAAVTLNPGTPRERRLRGREVDYELLQGDVVLLRSSGGGGFGVPADRSPLAIEEDLRNGYVTGHCGGETS